MPGGLPERVVSEYQRRFPHIEITAASGSTAQNVERLQAGELDVAFDDITHTFGYVQPERDREPIELSPEPNWGRVAYGGRR